MVLATSSSLSLSPSLRAPLPPFLPRPLSPLLLPRSLALPPPVVTAQLRALHLRSGGAGACAEVSPHGFAGRFVELRVPQVNDQHRAAGGGVVPYLESQSPLAQ